MAPDQGGREAAAIPPMKILDRYIGTHVVVSTLLALTVLVALFTFVDFVDDLDSVGKGDYTMGRSLEYMLLTLPRRTFALFPVAAVIGSLMGLGVLASNFELTVIRASGVSLRQITMAVMKGAAVLIVVVLVIGELVTPWCERIAQERRSMALNEQAALRTGFGFWVRDGASFINVRKVFPGNILGDIYIYEFDDDQHLRVATLARSATYQDGAWLLEGITQSTLADSGVSRSDAERAVWESDFAPNLVDIVAVRPESLSAIGLVRHLFYLRDNGLSTELYELALWTKIIYPLATGVMIFMAIPLVLGRFRASGVGLRMVAGAIMGISFHIVQQMSVQMAVVYNVNTALSAALPTVGFFALGLWMMSRVR
jgi:lipopolysaccharide export system permease protein